MGHTQSKQKTFDLKLSPQYCKRRAEKVKKILEEIEGVESVKIDKDLELGKVTISANVNPEKVVRKLKDKLHKDQEIHIVLQHYPVRKSRDQRRGLIIIHNCAQDDHKFEQKKYSKPFKCNKCREGGFELGYRCQYCTCELHVDCKNPKREITTDLYPESIFKYCKKGGKVCDVCGLRVHGHFYNCEEKKLNLHPACSKLPQKWPVDKPSFVLSKAKTVCLLCNSKKPHSSERGDTQVPGCCYVYKSDKFKFSCHVHCLSKWMEEAWKRGYFDHKGDNAKDGTSKALEKVVRKLVADAKGRGGKGGGSIPKPVIIFIKAAISSLMGGSSGWVDYAIEYAEEFLKAV